MPFIITGPGVLASRVDHSVVSNVDWLPTVASLARVQVPRGQLLRGQDLSPILRGELRHQTQRQQPLYWRGGGGSPPCWNRSPPMAMREGDWKLLFAPRKISEPPSAPAAYRVELYNVSLGALESQGGSFLESANEAECLDWITTRPDHSLTVVLKNNPDLAEKVRRSRKTTFGLGPALEAYNNDFRRGKFV